jgi:hypothetical protein
MNHLRSVLGCLTVVAALIVPNLAEASVRKCAITSNGLWVIVGEPILAVDGQIVGRLGPVAGAPGGGVPQPGKVYVNDLVPVQDDMLRVDIVCLEVPEGGKIVGRQTLAVITHSGAVDFMRSHLEALVALQEEHYASNGSFAANLWELDFFTSRAPLPIELSVQEEAWSARIALEGLSTVCLVEGGQQKESSADQPTSVVRCEAT